MQSCPQPSSSAPDGQFDSPSHCCSEARRGGVLDQGRARRAARALACSSRPCGGAPRWATTRPRCRPHLLSGNAPELILAVRALRLTVAHVRAAYARAVAAEPARDAIGRGALKAAAHLIGTIRALADSVARAAAVNTDAGTARAQDAAPPLWQHALERAAELVLPSGAVSSRVTPLLARDARAIGALVPLELRITEHALERAVDLVRSVGAIRSPIAALPPGHTAPVSAPRALQTSRKLAAKEFTVGVGVVGVGVAAVPVAK
eukprot:scaffold144077_cov31-Tisochrysis_lutea.AAC.8